MPPQIPWCGFVDGNAGGDEPSDSQGCVAVTPLLGIVDDGVTVQRFAARVKLIAKYSQLQRVSNALISKNHFSVQ